jgi:hypothetical protein
MAEGKVRGGFSWRGKKPLPRWNDRSGRTAKEVTTFLMRIANGERAAKETPDAR